MGKEKVTADKISLESKTDGLGLSGKEFGDIPDWKFYDFPSEEAWAQYIEQNRAYECDWNDEDE